MSHLMQIMTSSEDLTWATPQEWYNYLNLEFKFTLDPCSTNQNAKCFRHFTQEDDGLVQSWAEERVFMNPPYGREIPKWMKKAYEEARDNGALVVCLIPARVPESVSRNSASVSISFFGTILRLLRAAS